MTDDTEQFHGPDDAALDRLLATAAWPEPDTSAVRRLTRAVADERRRRITLRWPLTAAVAAAATLAGVCWLNRPAPHAANPNGVAVAPRPPVERQTTSPERVVVAAAPVPVSRPATMVERILLTTSRPDSPKAVGQEEPVPLQTDVREPASVVGRVDVLRDARQTLARAARAGGASQEDVAVAARLAAVATAADWPLVRAFIARPFTRDVSLNALITRRDDAVIDLLLRGVLDATLRPVVLNALAKSADLPTSAWLARFDAPQMDERWAAAVVLGRCADAGTLDRLAVMAERGEHRRESIAALLASDSPAARGLLARVARTRGVAPHVAPIREAIAVLIARGGGVPRCLFKHES